jgi:hypothetical protein
MRQTNPFPTAGLRLDSDMREDLLDLLSSVLAFRFLDFCIVFDGGQAKPL